MKTDTTPKTAEPTSSESPSTHCSADFEVGGGWGNVINWTRPEQFQANITEESRYDVTGWKRTHPKPGQTLKAEFKASWIIFEFVSIKPCGDPPDMFFAVVKPVRQILKQNDEHIHH